MTERIKSYLVEFGIPLLMLISALSVAQYQLTQKETIENHNADIQAIKSDQREFYSLLLDVRCQQEPTDRRCK